MALRTLVLALMSALVFMLPWMSGAFAIGLGGFGAMSMLGAAAFLFAALAILFDGQGFGRQIVPSHPAVTLFGVFVMLNFASVGWAQLPADALSHAVGYLQLLVFVWLILFLRDRPRSFIVLLHSFLFGGFLGVFLIYYSLGWNPLDDPAGRLSGLGRGANGLAYVLNLGIPIAIYLWSQRNHVSRWLYLLYIPLAVPLVILTASRTGFIILVLLVFAVLWFLAHTNSRNSVNFSVSRLLLLGLSAGLALLLVVPNALKVFAAQFGRLKTIAGPGTDEFGGRTQIWSHAIEVFFEHVFLGAGSGASRRLVLEGMRGDWMYLDPGAGISLHNLYLAIAADTGILGILLFGAMIFTLLFRIYGLPFQERWLLGSLAAASLLTGLVAGLETSRLFYFVLFLPLLVSMARPKIAKHDLRDSSPFAGPYREPNVRISRVGQQPPGTN